MRIGTKSLLFGAHQFLIHPLFVALAWFKLFGVPRRPELWVAFFVHDLGYWGKPNMDGEEGESHPLLGARIMTWLFGAEWGEFTMLHSRYWAQRLGKKPSDLCYADKLATCLTPWWLYVPFVRLTGEVREYKSAHKHYDMVSNNREDHSFAADRRWFRELQHHFANVVNTAMLERQLEGSRHDVPVHRD